MTASRFQNNKFIGCLLILFIWSSTAIAGGGPENVLLVVNEESSSSLTIANHFIHLRNIPDKNVLYLKNIPNSESTTIEVCKTTILQPVYDAMTERNLVGHIDYVVYSSDFPTAIGLPGTANQSIRPESMQKYFRPTASLNAVTYFMQQVMAEDYTFVEPTANHFMRQTFEEALANYYSGEAKTRYQQIIDAYEKEDFDAAFKAATVLANSTNSRPVMRYWQARCLAQLDRENDAITALKLAAKAGWGFGKPTREDKAFTSLADNPEFKTFVDSLPEQSSPRQPSQGFRSGMTFRPNGMRTNNSAEGRKYLLSVVLGCTRGKGNSVDEVVSALKKSVAADMTQPKGTFYFVSNNEVRSRTRASLIPEAVASLKALNHTAEVIKTAMPSKAKVMGAVTGISAFDFSKSESVILPGAICENLTSYGGVMTGERGKGQTTVSEFIKHGAAGSSGTVVEPYTIPHKFPHPNIHVHYARGCTLAESFYQSVHGPYQLLIVGDPLCQPFAQKPEFTVSGISAGAVIKGKIEIAPQPSTESKVKIAAFDLFYNGRKIKTLSPGGTAQFNSEKVTDGYCEFRVVAIADGLIQTRASQVFEVMVKNGESQFDIEVTEKDYVTTGEIQFNLPELKNADVVVLQNGRVVGTSDPAGKLKVDCSKLGLGPVRLKLRATKNNKSMESRSFVVNIAAEANP